jgi:hypothetical protein
MKEHARVPGAFARRYAPAWSFEDVLNRPAEFKTHPYLLLAREIEFWPRCRNDRAPIRPADDLPDNPLTAEILAVGIAGAFPRR